MSIFPKYVSPGSNVVFHIRFPGPRNSHVSELEKPVFPVLSASVRPPGGELQQIASWQTCFYPRPSVSNPRSWDEQIAPGFRKRAPLLLVANRLAGTNRSQDDLVSLLAGIRSSSHFYHVIQIPPDAPLGRYETVVETFLHGKHHQKYNNFWVESLEIKAIERKGAGLTAAIFNPSPEATKAVLVEFATDSNTQIESTPVILRGNAITTLDIQAAKGFLFFADDTCWIPLVEDDDCYCLRNQEFAWLENQEGNEIHLFPSGHPEDAYALGAEARQVWLAADGLHLKSEIRSPKTARTYDLMVDRRLIEEIPGNQIVRGAAVVAAPDSI